MAGDNTVKIEDDVARFLQSQQVTGAVQQINSAPEALEWLQSEQINQGNSQRQLAIVVCTTLKSSWPQVAETMELVKGVVNFHSGSGNYRARTRAPTSVQQRLSNRKCTFSL